MTTRITPDDILTDDRIDAMRTHVMAAVDSDVRARRTGRRRRTAGIAAAAAVVAVVAGGGIVLGTQTGGSSSAPAADRAGGAAPTMGFSAPEAAAPTATRTVAPNAAPERTPAPSTPTPEQTSRQVITTGSVALRMDDPAGAAEDLAAEAERLGGRVDERTESGTDDAKRATLRLRVPNDKVDDLVAKVGRLGEVRSVSLQHEDVTTTVVDLDARIRATQLSVDRLTEILSRADTSDKVIAAEGALTQRQQELESLQSRRTSIGEQVALSTVTVSITTPSAGEDRGGFLGGLEDGWNAMVGAAHWLVVAVGAVLPWAALLLVLYGAYRVARRFRRRA